MRESTKFIKTGTKFILIIIISVLIINTIYIKFIIDKKQVYRQEISYQGYIANLTDKKIKYAFFGDSHTHDGINPNYINNSFNFATSGETYAQTYYKLKRVLEKDNIKINNIFLQMDLHSLSVSQEGLINNVYLYSKFMSFNEIRDLYRGSLIGLLTGLYLPFIGNGEQFFFLITKPQLKGIYKGWVKQEENFLLVKDRKTASKKTYNLFFKRERIDNISFKYFKKTLSLAKENNINIIFIKYPLSKDLDNVIKGENTDKEDYYTAIFKEVDLKLNNNYRVLDYYNLFFNHTNYFSDPDHLNYIGADILSKQVLNDINKLNLTISKENKETGIIMINPNKEKKSIEKTNFYFIISIIILFDFIILIIWLNSFKNKQVKLTQNI